MTTSGKKKFVELLMSRLNFLEGTNYGNENMICRSNEFLNDVKDLPGPRDEEIDVNKDMSIDELIQASEDVPRVIEDAAKLVEEKKEPEVRC